MKQSNVSVFFVILFFSGSLLKGKQLQILYLIDSYPKITETFIFESIAGMIDRGHKISIYARQKTKEEIKHPIISKHDLDTCVYIKEVPANLITYDVILCQFGDLNFRVPEALVNHTIPYITCIRGSDITQKLDKKRNRYEKLFQQCDLFLPVCDYFKNKLQELGCPAHKIKVHRSPIDCSVFSYQERSIDQDERIELISVGRLVAKKGRKKLLQALSMIKKEHPSIHLTIIGDGEEKEILLKYTKLLGLTKNVTFVYAASQSEVRDVLARSHIFVLTSETAVDGNEEGIPNALKEAMASGVPVVATNHAGNSELITDGETGLLVSEKNPRATANAVLYLIDHPDQWPEMTKKARNVSENYDRKKLAEELENIIYQLIEEKLGR
jgi:colanic acid/amylovoran biosynthesis glycosyltransferase